MTPVGWWGPEPPCHGPVFRLTHHERAPLELVPVHSRATPEVVHVTWRRPTS